MIVHTVPQEVASEDTAELGTLAGPARLARLARLDRYLAEALQLPRSRIMDAFAAGNVRVNGRRAKKGDPVQPGSEITAEISNGPTPPTPQPELELKVLREDSSFVVLNKPAGMAPHPLDEGERGTLANALAARYPECTSAGDDPRECGLAHRLDIETSGTIVAARSKEAFRKLRDAFSNRTVEKLYIALVGGAPGEGGEIDLAIAHHPGNQRKMIACALDEDVARLKARPAQTLYRVIERVGDFALVHVRIPTGVMHQIRVHMAAIGAPVAGDNLYDGPSLKGLSHHFLHAAELAFPHPETGEMVRVSAPLPRDLEMVLEDVRK